MQPSLESMHTVGVRTQLTGCVRPAACMVTSVSTAEPPGRYFRVQSSCLACALCNSSWANDKSQARRMAAAQFRGGTRIWQGLLQLFSEPSSDELFRGLNSSSPDEGSGRRASGRSPYQFAAADILVLHAGEQGEQQLTSLQPQPRCLSQGRDVYPSLHTYYSSTPPLPEQPGATVSIGPAHQLARSTGGNCGRSCRTVIHDTVSWRWRRNESYLLTATPQPAAGQQSYCGLSWSPVTPACLARRASLEADVFRKCPLAAQFDCARWNLTAFEPVASQTLRYNAPQAGTRCALAPRCSSNAWRTAPLSW